MINIAAVLRLYFHSYYI